MSKVWCLSFAGPAMTGRRSTTERGYDAAHQAERERLRPTVDAGEAWCSEPVCLMPDRWIAPGMPWDLAHDRDRPGEYHGPAHARCNRAEGGRHRHRRAAEDAPAADETLWWRP